MALRANIGPYNQILELPIQAASSRQHFLDTNSIQFWFKIVDNGGRYKIFNLDYYDQEEQRVRERWQVAYADQEIIQIAPFGLADVTNPVIQFRIGRDGLVLD